MNLSRMGSVARTRPAGRGARGDLGRTLGALLAAVAAAVLLALPAPTCADEWESPETISDGTEDAIYPRIATRSGPGNRVHVVWRDLGASELSYRRSRNGGASWYAIQTLDSGSVVMGPRIATSGNTVHVVWRGADHGIMYLRSTSNGGVWDAPKMLSTAAPDTAGYTPDVAAAGDRVYVVWIKSDVYDVLYVESTDNGATFSTPGSITADGATIEESEPRVAASGTNAYFAWLANDNVIYRRKTGAIWDFPITMWTNDSEHVSIAARDSFVYLDRNDAANGPAQKVSSSWGATGTFSADIWLGFGDDRPELSTSMAYMGNGATAFLDFRDGFSKIFASTGFQGEDQVGTITGSSQTVDIGAMKSGSMHLIANSSGVREVIYYRYLAPQGFDWWWQAPDGVSKSDAQWGDFDNDGDLDLVIAGSTIDEPIPNYVTQTFENDEGALTLRQSLEGVISESSGNLGWGDYDGDGDLDLVVTGLGVSGRITRIYENNGLGTLAVDAAQVLTQVDRSAVAWGDYDNDGDLDLFVAGYDGSANQSILYVNDPLGTLTPHLTMTLVGVRNGSADWADWDGDGDLDLLVSGYDGSSRRIIFYENDPVGTLTDSGPKGVDGVNLSDSAFGDYDGDGDLDLICTGEEGTGGPRVFAVYANDGLGNFTETAILGIPQIYRSSGAWGDYDNDGDLDFGLCGYDGVGLYTLIYENTGAGFAHASDFYFPGIRDGSITWADVDGDGGLDFFMTGWDWGARYADLYENLEPPANTPPIAPSTLTCEKRGLDLELSWSGASDTETAAAGLYYVLRVGTVPGGHDIVSGTYASPLMGNVGQAPGRVLTVVPDTYYWSVRSVDSGFMSSEWAPEETCEFCPTDIDSNSDTGFSDLLVVLSTWGPCPPSCPGDIDGDDEVGFTDLLAVLSFWGPCP